jgi:hypothetical protein
MSSILILVEGGTIKKMKKILCGNDIKYLLFDIGLKNYLLSRQSK